MKKVLIGGGASNQVYAPATGALTTVNGATSVDLLASGGLAVYGFVDVVSGSLNAGTLGKDILINDSASNTADTGDADDFINGGANEIITIAQGGVVTPVQVYGINRKGVTRITKQIYVAPSRQVSFIGYNGVVGAINMPTVTQGSEATLLAVQQEASTPDQIRSQEDYGIGNIAASTSEYSVLSGVVNAINTAFTKTHTAYIVSNGTRTNTTTTGNATVTNGSSIIAFTAIPAAGWVAAVGQFVSINNTAVGTTVIDAAATNVNGTVYQIVAINGNNVTLDRPYRGTTATITGIQTGGAGAGAIALVASITAMGIKLVVDDATRVYNYALQGLLQNANITAYYTGTSAGTQVTAPSKGSGTGAAVVAIENGLIAYRGQLDTVDRRMKQLPRYASATENYVSYTIQFRMTTNVTGVPHNRGENSTVIVFVPTGQTSITLFEGILKKLCVNASINY
jgi:hypothetical protein